MWGLMFLQDTLSRVKLNVFHMALVVTADKYKTSSMLLDVSYMSSLLTLQRPVSCIDAVTFAVTSTDFEPSL